MENRPRRSLLCGLAGSVTLAAGCLSSPETERDPDAEPETDPESDPDDSETDPSDEHNEPEEPAEDDDGEILAASLFEFVPASIAADTMSVSAAVPGPLQELPSWYRHVSIGQRLDIDPTNVDRQVVVTSGERNKRVIVLAGDFELEGEPVRAEHDGVEFDRYEIDDGVAAAYDDHLVVAGSNDVLTDAIDARRGAADRLLEQHSGVESGLAAAEGDHLTSVYFGIGESVAGQFDVEAEAVRYLRYSVTVPDSETIGTTYGLEFDDADAVTDDVATAFAEEITEHRGPFLEEPSTSADGTTLTVSFVEDLAARREMEDHESPAGLHVRDVDQDDEYVEIELGYGDPTPVEDLTLELGGEVYDPEIWADGAETVEAGDVLRVRMDDVEPGTEVTLRHEMNGVVSTSSTSLLRHLEFEFDRDPERGTIAVTYRDEYPLPGDDLTIAVFDADGWKRPPEIEPGRTIQPWTGDSVEAGDRAEIEGVEYGQWVLVTFGGDSFDDAVSRHLFRPPGTASFEHDPEADRLAVSLEFEHHDSRPADEYEIRVDEEPADVQWGDDGRIESGATVHLEAPAFGTRVTVVWTDGEIPVGSTRIEPTVDVEFRRGDDLVLEHVGGQALPVEKLDLHATGDDVRSHVRLEEVAEGRFEEGDTIEVELEADLEDVEVIFLVYDGMLIAEERDEE